MLYDIRHVTNYAYGTPTPFARHVLRLMPCDRDGLKVRSRALVIEPTPTEREDVTDFFGNALTTIAIDEAHEKLVVTMVARIEVDQPDLPAPETTPDLLAIRELAYAASDLGGLSPAHYVFPSRRIPLEPQIRAYAAESVVPGRPILEAVLEFNNRFIEDFVYEPGATDADTPPAVSFEMRRGVCQDFAHVMISGLRGLGVPAAYVSGYLRTIPPPGVARLQGADAMHAWVAVWCGPDAGWIGLDPTNGVPAGLDHIVLAIGRDYADVAPVEGVIVTSGGQHLGVAVDVIPVEEAPRGREDVEKAPEPPAAAPAARPAP